MTKIDGICEKKARLLLDDMPYAKIKTASEKELTSIKGISEKDARAIHEYFNKKVK